MFEFERHNSTYRKYVPIRNFEQQALIISSLKNTREAVNSMFCIINAKINIRRYNALSFSLTIIPPAKAKGTAPLILGIK